MFSKLSHLRETQRFLFFTQAETFVSVKKCENKRVLDKKEWNLANRTRKSRITQKLNHFALITYTLSNNIDSIFHAIKAKK